MEVSSYLEPGDAASIVNVMELPSTGSGSSKRVIEPNSLSGRSTSMTFLPSTETPSLVARGFLWYRLSDFW